MKKYNGKYSLRFLMEGRVEFGNMTFSVDTNSDVAKAIRVEGAGANFANVGVDDYIDKKGDPISNKRNELGNIIMLDMIRRGFEKDMGFYGNEAARDPSKAAGGMMEELVRAAFEDATSLNVMSFSNNEPFADVAIPFGRGVEYISVKFTGQRGSSRLKQEQIKYLEASLENKQTSLRKSIDRLSAIEIALDGDNFVISKVGPQTPSDFTSDNFKKGSVSTGVSAAQTRTNTTEQQKTIALPPQSFFTNLKRKAPDFVYGLKLARQTSRVTGDRDVSKAQRTSSGAYASVGDDLADKVAGFVNKTGNDGRDAIKKANAIQKLLVKALESLEAAGAKVDSTKVEELQKKLAVAYDEIDKVDGPEDDDVNLAEVKNKLFEWAIK